MALFIMYSYVVSAHLAPFDSNLASSIDLSLAKEWLLWSGITIIFLHKN